MVFVAVLPAQFPARGVRASNGLMHRSKRVGAREQPK
jgi:hypothetical protein